MGSGVSFESVINDEYLLNIVSMNSDYLNKNILSKDWEGIEIELEEFTLSAFDEAIKSIDDDKDVGIILSCDAIGLDSLSSLTSITKHEEFHHVRELRISNNTLNDNNFININKSYSDNNDDNGDHNDIATTDMNKLSKLSIGGNPIKSLLSITTGITNNRFLPHYLLELDCSYCHELDTTSGCFLCVPQLKRLTLDGCNISRTCSNSNGNHDGNILVNQQQEEQQELQQEENNNIIRKLAFDYCQKNDFSIFTGLVQLESLSLKENFLTTLEDMKGLEYFFRFNTLLTLYIEDNAISEEKRNLDALEEYLCITTTSNANNDNNNNNNNNNINHNINNNINNNGLGSLQCIDNRLVNETKVIAQNKIAQGISHIHLKRGEGEDGSSRDIRGAGDVDVMEQEYLAALKGEQDSTVVS